MDKKLKEVMSWICLLVGIVLLTAALPQNAAAQDLDDPPSRVARLGYMKGSVSFQPAGESDWVQAVPNRPMTTGDQLWADQDSRVEVELGSAVIRLAGNTGFSFLNLDDRTMQIQLTSGSLNISVRRLNRDDVFEVDTPNLAFSVFQSGRYRVEASEDGDYTVISVREGEGEATGNGQSYTLHAGQRATFSGMDSLNADVVEIGGPDDFDNWAYSRERRHRESRSAQYLSPDIVGYEDLDDYGDWRDDSNYGHVWFPTRVSAGWAPYREGHWAWISPWGWTWVDDASWGYAPFHYGRWVTVRGRWGWVAGPINVAPVYAPALVVFFGGGGSGISIGFGGNVGWFPLGPREVYVPSYNVSRGYMTRVNISNTTVNNTTITNVYNTTIVNRSTNITNVTYRNRNVAGAVTMVPQRAFITAQPVAAVAVTVNMREIASRPVSSRATVAPSRESVLGSRSNSAGRVTAPPPAVARRQVIAKAPPPPPPVPFERQQKALAENPGKPLERNEVQTLRPANTSAERPTVKQAPPGKRATPNSGRSNIQPGNAPSSGRPGQPVNEQPVNRPGNRPASNEPSGVTNPPVQPSSRPESVSPEPAPRSQTPPPNERMQQRAPIPENPATPNVTPNVAPNTDRPDNRPGNAPKAGRSDRPANAQPANRRGNQTPSNEPPGVTNPVQPNAMPESVSPEPTQPPAKTEPAARKQQRAPIPEKPATPNVTPNVAPNTDRPDNQPGNAPKAGRSDRPANAQPANRRGTQTPSNEPPVETNPVQPNAKPEVVSPEPTPPAAKNEPTAQKPQRSQSKQLTPEEKKRQDEQKKLDEKKRKDEQRKQDKEEQPPQ